MDDTSTAPGGIYRSWFWLYTLVQLRNIATRGLSRRTPRPAVADPAPPPLLTFGMTVDGRPVRGTRWGFGPKPMVYLVPGRDRHTAPTGGLVRTLLAAGYGVVALDAPADAIDLALGTVEARYGPASAVLTPDDPDDAHPIAGLLTGRRVRF